LENGGYVSWV